MLRLYDVLKTGRTGIYPDLQTMLAARKMCGDGYRITTENDYIYGNDTIIYYIGSEKRPKIPLTLGGIQVRTIEKTAFAGRDVKAVKIPDGTEVIE